MRFLIYFFIDLQNCYLDGVSARDPIKDANGNEILQLPIYYAIFGLISSAIGLTVLMYGLINYDSDDIYLQLIFFILFGGIGLYLILFQRVEKIILTDKYIINNTILGQRKVIAWKHITDVSFNKITWVLKIQAKGVSIKCHRHLVGFPVLIDRLDKKLKIRKISSE